MTNKKDKEFLEKNKNIESYEEILKLFKEGKITKEEVKRKVKIREKFDKLNNDKEYKDYRNNQIAHGILDITTALIPLGGGAKVIGKIGGKAIQKGIEKLTPYTGKKIAEGIIKGTIDGAVIGSGHGMVSSIIDEKNPTPRTIKEGTIGAVIGLGASAIGGKTVRKVEGEKLKKYKPDTKNSAREDVINYRKMGKEYYKNYLLGTSVNIKNYGKVKFGGDNAIKTSPHNLDVYPDLKQQLKKSKKTDNTNWKQEKDRTYDHLENTYKNRKMDYEIEVFNNGEKYFKMIKETGLNSPTGTNPVAGQTPPKNIIPNQKPILNYPKALEDENVQRKIYNGTTKTEMLSLFKNIEKDNSKKEDNSARIKSGISINYDGISVDGKKYKDWSKKEKESFLEGFNSNSFTDSRPYKTNNIINNNKDKTGKMDLDNTDNGHWVTINHNHVFIED